MRTAIAILASIELCCVPAFAEPNPAALMNAAKQASGGDAWNAIGALHEQGELAASGLDGHYEQWIDLKGEREASRYDLGPSTGAEGWDGRRKWNVDSSGDVRVETSKQSAAGAIQQAYRDAYGFFFPQRRSVALADAGVRTADGRTFDAVKASPDGTDAFEIWFDRKTHLISREVQLAGDQPETFIFSDWRAVDGVLLPFRTVVRTAGNAKFDQISRATRIETADQPSPSRFTPPKEIVDPAAWPAGRSSVTVPFQLINNHIYVRASINGKSPANVIFDTGATDILELGHAADLGVKVVGALPIGGIGNNVASYGLAKVKSVSIGGVTLVDQVFGAVDLDAIRKVEDADFQALVGYEFAKRAVLTIDYAARTLTFTRPETFRPPSNATPIPFTFREHTPIVSAEADGAPGQFELDTGARTGLMIMGPFAAAHGLAAKYRPADEMTVSYGVGGPSRARVARIGALTIGGTTLQAPVADLVTGASGDAASTYIAGNIGGDILKRFTLTLDYPHQRLWLQPNALASMPETFDRSGLWLSRAADGNIAVGDVAHGSPAQSARIAAGDEILAVNGRSARQVRLYALREALKGRPGAWFTLVVKHGAEVRNVGLRLGSGILGTIDKVHPRSPTSG